MVSGRGAPLVSGSSSTRPPAASAKAPGDPSENTLDCILNCLAKSRWSHAEKPTKDDEWQLHPDFGQPVEKERTHKATDVAQRGAHRHTKVPATEQLVSWLSHCGNTTHLYSPDKRRVELRVDKHHHLQAHRDPQPAHAGHHRLKPEHVWGITGRERGRSYNQSLHQYGAAGSYLSFFF